MFAHSLVLCFALGAASTVFAKEQILCHDPDAKDAEAAQEIFVSKWEKLQNDGYVFHDFVEKQVKKSYVGTGLRLMHTEDGFIVTYLSVPGSPAARTGFFDQPYIVFEVDGKSVLFDDIKDVKHTIRGGNGKSNTGVVLTLQRRSGGRDYVRFLERKRITLTDTVGCARFQKKP